MIIHTNKNNNINHYNLEIVSKLIDSISDISVLDILVNNNAIIAGGALTSIIVNF